MTTRCVVCGAEHGSGSAPPAALVLDALSAYGACAAGELVAMTGLGRHAVWSALRKLVRRGLVVPSRAARVSAGRRWRLRGGARGQV